MILLKKDKKVKINDILLMNAPLKNSIVWFNNLLFGVLFDVNARLIEVFKNLKDRQDFKEFSEAIYYEDLKRDQFVFAFPLTPVRT
jgi:hypothetical protein